MVFDPFATAAAAAAAAIAGRLGVDICVCASPPFVLFTLAPVGIGVGIGIGVGVGDGVPGPLAVPSLFSAATSTCVVVAGLIPASRLGLPLGLPLTAGKLVAVPVVLVGAVVTDCD